MAPAMPMASAGLNPDLSVSERPRNHEETTLSDNRAIITDFTNAVGPLWLQSLKRAIELGFTSLTVVSIGAVLPRIMLVELGPREWSCLRIQSQSLHRHFRNDLQSKRGLNCLFS